MKSALQRIPLHDKKLIAIYRMYEQRAKTCVLMVHDYSQEGEKMIPFAESLADENTSVDILAMTGHPFTTDDRFRYVQDLPDELSSPFTLENAIQELGEVIDRRHSDTTKADSGYFENIILFGHGVGGVACAYVAQQNPGKVKGVYIATPFLNIQNRLPPSLLGQLDHALTSMVYESVGETLGAAFDWLRRREGFSSLYRFPLSELGELKVPVRLVFGEADRETFRDLHVAKLADIFGEDSLQVIRGDENFNLTRSNFFAYYGTGKGREPNADLLEDFQEFKSTLGL